jgi:hypothetical protein
MASEAHEPVRFDNNAAIAAEVEHEKTEDARDNDSDISEDTRVAQHEHTGDDAQQESKLERPGTYDKVEITEEDCYDELGCEYKIPPGWLLQHPNVQASNPPKTLQHSLREASVVPRSQKPPNLTKLSKSPQCAL